MTHPAECEKLIETESLYFLKITNKKLAEYILKYGPTKFVCDNGKNLVEYEVCAVDIREDVATPVAAIEEDGKRKWFISASIPIKERWKCWSKKEALQIINNENLKFRIKGTTIPFKFTDQKDVKLNSYINDGFMEELIRTMEYSIEKNKWSICGKKVGDEEYDIDVELEKYSKRIVKEYKHK